jgi:hypothetical protein
MLVAIFSKLYTTPIVFDENIQDEISTLVAVKFTQTAVGVVTAKTLYDR